MIAAMRLSRFILAPLALLAGLAMTLPARAEVAFREITSPGGITAWMVEDYTVPIITLAFAFDGGSTQDPDGLLGSAYLLTTLLDEGAGDLDSDAFQTRQDEVGLDMGFSVGLDTFSGFARMLADEREGATDLLSLAITAPRFDQPALDRMRSQVISRIVARSQAPGYAASRMWNEALFEDHPYGRPVEGTEETLSAITADNLRALHRAIFARDNLTVGIVGALDEATAGALIDQVFGSLPQAPDLVPVSDAQMTFGQELDVAYPLPQTWINLAYPGIAEADDDFFAAYVMSEILAGGSLLSELNVEVREKRGLSYGVSGGLVNFDHADAMMINTATRPDQAAQALDVIHDTIARIAQDGPDPAALERTKRYLIGAYPINQLRSSVSIAGAMVGQQRRDLPIDYVDERTRRIEAVTADDVKAAAQRIFGTQPSVMLVGQGAAPGDVAD